MGWKVWIRWMKTLWRLEKHSGEFDRQRAEMSLKIAEEAVVYIRRTTGEDGYTISPEAQEALDDFIYFILCFGSKKAS